MVLFTFCCCLCCLYCTNHVCVMDGETRWSTDNWTISVKNWILFILQAKSFQVNRFNHDKKNFWFGFLRFHIKKRFSAFIWYAHVNSRGYCHFQHIYSHEHKNHWAQMIPSKAVLLHPLRLLADKTRLITTRVWEPKQTAIGFLPVELSFVHFIE